VRTTSQGCRRPDAAVLGERAPVALFLAGGPFAGKTTVLNQLTAQGDEFVPGEAVLVDPAEIRTMLPEWRPLIEAGEPGAARMVREEAIDVARKLFQQAIEGGLNVIVEGIGAGEAGAFADLLKRTRDAGYDVRVLLVDAPTQIALDRARAWQDSTGFAFNAETIARLHRDCSRRFEEWSGVSGVAVTGLSTS
jgi:predicted ATPase